MSSAADPAADPAANPLLRPWDGPHGGVPPFDRVRVADFEPALEAAMADQLAAIDRITAEADAPTFENTTAALERAGRVFDRVRAVYEVYGGGMNDEAMQAVERRMAPRLAAFADRIAQNEKLFARVAAVYEARERSGLSPEQQRLVWLHFTDLVRAGARLDAAAKRELAAINEELATLHTAFSQNVLKDESDAAVFIEDEAGVAGLPAAAREAAAVAARDRGRTGWAVPNTRSSVEPFLASADRRDLREKVWRMFVGRGDGGGATDNNQTIARILALRARRAKLLGFPTHAHWRLENSMAKTPERAVALMEEVWKPAVARVREEVADMQAVSDAEGAGIRIEPWDYRYYAEKVRKQKYDLDESEITPYLQLEKLREGMFFMAGELFGFRFTPADPRAVPVYHPDVRAWEVTGRDGRLAGLFYFDPYARKGKRSGAWMSGYRSQERFDGDVPAIVSNNCNYAKPAPGEPILISWEDATTLFHEFGHALHGLCSDVEYPSLSGTNVARDYVEFPSQLLEHWLSTPEILDRFAVHCETGRPLPRELAEKIERAARFNAGFRTVEFLGSAIVDMKLHLAGETPIDPDRFERETLAALGMPAEIVMRHRTPHFNHIFADDGYSAGYYSYLWADTITADAWEAFTEAGGPWDKGVAEKLRRHVFSAGNTVDPAAGYRAFRGRDAGIDALMRKRGFPVPQPAAGPWPEERARAWGESTGWLVGCNYIPATAVNQLEMWQADTFDPERIDLELGWAESLGFNSLRVFLHDIPYAQDPRGFLERIDRFLAIAEKHRIGVMFVLFDGCWDPRPQPGPQRAPRPHVHNSGWVQGPGREILGDESRQAALAPYVKGVVGRFRDDRRVQAWDIFNELDNANEASYGKVELADKPRAALALARKAFAWAREAEPSQPLTACVWRRVMSPAEQFCLEQSDIVSFHHYGSLEQLRDAVATLRQRGRPILCTEFMARPVGSTFDPQLGFMQQERVGAYCWGFVAGKTQTTYPWDSWEKSYAAEPPVWFHDIFRNDGTPYRAAEAAYIRGLTGKGPRPDGK